MQVEPVGRGDGITNWILNFSTHLIQQPRRASLLTSFPQGVAAKVKLNLSLQSWPPTWELGLSHNEDR